MCSSSVPRGTANRRTHWKRIRRLRRGSLPRRRCSAISSSHGQGEIGGCSSPPCRRRCGAHRSPLRQVYAACVVVHFRSGPLVSTIAHVLRSPGMENQLCAAEVVTGSACCCSSRFSYSHSRSWERLPRTSKGGKMTSTAVSASSSAAWRELPASPADCYRLPVSATMSISRISAADRTRRTFRPRARIAATICGPVQSAVRNVA